QRTQCSASYTSRLYGPVGSFLPLGGHRRDRRCWLLARSNRYPWLKGRRSPVGSPRRRPHSRLVAVSLVINASETLRSWYGRERTRGSQGPVRRRVGRRHCP